MEERCLDRVVCLILSRLSKTTGSHRSAAFTTIRETGDRCWSAMTCPYVSPDTYPRERSEPYIGGCSCSWTWAWWRRCFPWNCTGRRRLDGHVANAARGGPDDSRMVEPLS